MLLLTKMSAVFAIFLIAGGCFSAVVNENSEQSIAVFSNHFQAIVDANMEYFVVPSDENPFPEPIHEPMPKITNTYSKKLSVVNGGGTIVNMEDDAFSQMRVISYRKGAFRTQCRSSQEKNTGL